MFPQLQHPVAQVLYPGLHVYEHDVPLQEETPFAGVSHGVHEEPQVRGAVSSTHAPLQT
jgi:hypothetical protein